MSVGPGREQTVVLPRGIGAACASSSSVRTGGAHALAWALDNSASVDEVAAAPGNPGIAAMGKRCVPVDANDPAAVARLAGEIAPDLVVVSAEEPLVHGVADALRTHGTLVFGPGADGARLEGSKAWMKAVLAEAGVPTAAPRRVHRRPGGRGRLPSSNACPASTW